MVNLSGYYKAPDGRVIVKDDEGVLHLASDPNEKHSFRPDKQFFLCEDDGLVGKYGNPKAVKAVIDGTTYRVWVEQRGPEEFGLIPTNEDGVYSNRFLSIDSASGDNFSIADDWGDKEKFKIIKDA